MSKVKQKVEINGQSFATGGIGMSDSTFKEIPANMKQGNKLFTLTYFRNCVQNGEFKGKFTVGTNSGFLFKHNNDNILVDENMRTFIAAFKDKEDIHICKSKINKSDIKPLSLNQNTGAKPPSQKIQIGDLIFDPSSIELSDHFLLRCKERFYITDRNQARKFMEDIILNGEYLGIVKDKDFNNETHLFSMRSIGVFIDPKTNKAVTTYIQDEYDTFSKPKKLIKELMTKKINHLKRKMSTKYKHNTLKGFDINRELINLEERMFKTRSQSVKLACQARINALLEEQSLMNDEFNQLSKELNDFTKSMIPFV